MVPVRNQAKCLSLVKHTAKAIHHFYCSSSLIKDAIVGNKAEVQISKRMFQDNKAHQIFQKTDIFYPLIRTVWEKFEKFDVLCFLETPVLRFALLLYYRRNNAKQIMSVYEGII